MKNVLLSGGIGDFLQSLPFLLSPEARECRLFVASHQAGAQDLFDRLGVTVERFFLFSDPASHREVTAQLAKIGEMSAAPRAQYLAQNPFPAHPKRFGLGHRKVIGVHLGGSGYAIGVQKSWGVPPKNLPREMLDRLGALPHDFLVFGTAEELAELGIQETGNISIVSCDSVYDSLGHVSQCDAFVGSDSAFKTLTAMLKIPTMIWLGDYKDDPRDTLFVTPYVTDGVMEVFRYTDLSQSHQLDAGLLRTTRFLNDTFAPRDGQLWTTLFQAANGPMILNLRDRGVSGDIMQTGHFEPQQVALLSDLTRYLMGRQRRVTIYDVGANLGTHTLALARLSPSRIRVRAFEVQSRVFYMLCGSVALNRLGNVDCHHLAVGDVDGAMLSLQVPSYSEVHNFGSFEVEQIQRSDNQAMAKPHTEQVRVATLDSFGEPVDLLKIDVEGMEEKVLDGSRELFARSSPICFIEVFKSDLRNIAGFLASRGYAGYSTHQDLLAIPTRFGLQINGLSKIF
jgi:FkbM family methyltransferase